MTSNDISNFLTSMSEAKRAFDAEPGYQERIRELEQRLLTQGQTIADREIRIHNLKQFETELNAKLRSVEAERDDAGFRALEEADKVQGLLSLVHGVINDALKAVSAVEGYEQIVVNKVDRQRELDHATSRQERIVELELELANRDRDIYNLKTDISMAQEQLHRPFAAATVQGTEGVSGSGEISSLQPEPWYDPAPKTYELKAEDQRVADPTAPSTDTGNSVPTQVVGTQENALDISGSGQSEGPLPTSQERSNVSAWVVDSGIGTQRAESDGPFAPTETTLSQPATSTGAEDTTAVASNASGPERNRDESTRFTGRKYFDVTYFVPLHEWLNKGGAREDYYWRPVEANTPLPEPSRASQQSS